MLLDDRVVAIYGSDIWNRMTDKERRQVRHHLQASQISQFMHGEQGALIATAKIVQTVPNLDANSMPQRRSWTRRAMSRPIRASCTTNSSSPTRSPMG